MTGIIFSGFGGQGILTTGMIAAEAGMKLGMNVTWYPSYGSQMRGGTANCNVKLDTKAIASPYVKAIDILCAMNVASVDKFMPQMKPGALLLVDAGAVPVDYPVRDDIKVVRVPVGDIANDCGNPKGANLVMLGAIAGNSDLFEVEKLAELVDEFFAKKGKTNPKNKMCLIAGADCK